MLYMRAYNTYCHVSVSGKPRPNVTWYFDNTVIDESFESAPDGVTTVNYLSYPNIGRQHLNARFVCMASNTNLTPPNNKVVILDINCKINRFYKTYVKNCMGFFCYGVLY